MTPRALAYYLLAVLDLDERARYRWIVETRITLDLNYIWGKMQSSIPGDSSLRSSHVLLPSTATHSLIGNCDISVPTVHGGRIFLQNIPPTRECKFSRSIVTSRLRALIRLAQHDVTSLARRRVRGNNKIVNPILEPISRGLGRNAHASS